VRVLQVAPSFPRIGCGIGDHVARLTAELAGRGVEVHLATDPPEPAAAPRAAGGATVHEIFRRHTLGEMRLAARLARGLRPDLVHIHHQIITYTGRAAILCLPRLLQRARAGAAVTPVIVTLHDLQLPRIFRGADPLRRLLLRGYLRRATVVVNSAAQRGQALAAGATDPAIRILRIPSNVEIHPPAAAELQALRERFGLGAGSVLVCFGTVALGGGIDLLLSALAELPAAARQRLRCLLVGQAPAYSKDPAGDLQAVRDRITHLGLQPTVTVTGFLPSSEVSALLQLSDAVMLARHQAIAASTTAAAAFLHAKPLLAIGAREDSDTAADAAIPESAIHWSAADPEALAATIRRLVQGEPLWAESARRDLAANAPRFSWAHVAGQYLDLYREIAR
jgi:glycosyltransferase involved in cell wall biosynthesis